MSQSKEKLYSYVDSDKNFVAEDDGNIYESNTRVYSAKKPFFPDDVIIWHVKSDSGWRIFDSTPKKYQLFSEKYFLNQGLTTNVIRIREDKFSLHGKNPEL